LNFHRSERMFQFTNGLIIFLLSFTMIAPMIHLVAVSLSTPKFAEAKLVYLWPKGFYTGVYESLFQMGDMWRAMGVSIYITLSGTALCLLLTTTLSFTLTRPAMPARRWLIRLILFTFIFPVPMIPGFLLVKSLGMIDSLWSLIIPGALSAYFIFINKTFFQGIPAELIDSVKMDGCGEFGVFVRLVLPLSKPVLATIALFHAVSQWNSYFGALIYIRTKDLFPLQLKLRNLVQSGNNDSGINGYTFDVSAMQTPEMIKAGAILFSTVPILIIYPFLQRYFVQGAMLGSLKE